MTEREAIKIVNEIVDELDSRGECGEYTEKGIEALDIVLRLARREGLDEKKLAKYIKENIKWSPYGKGNCLIYGKIDDIASLICSHFW